ncbi:MAG: VWA domain-containing protein [Phycisphaerales bacterium]
MTETSPLPTSSTARPARVWTLGRVAGAVGLFGLAASIWIHVVVAIAGVLFGTLLGGSGIASGLGSGEREIALGPQTSLAELAAGTDGEAPSLLDKPLDAAAQDASLASVMADIPDPTALGSDSGSVGGGAGDPAGFMTGGDGGDGGSGVGGGGGDGGAKFFGIEARGKRFAYLCDVSGSMDEERLSALKRELENSIAELSPSSSFSVILFSSDARILTGDGWLEANPTNKAKTKTLLRAVQSYGGTMPLPGFALLFSSLRPRPDAVYFMTDGQILERPQDEDKMVAQITALSRSGPKAVPVHCVTMIETSSRQVMEKIARTTGGKYRHVSGAQPIPGGGGGGGGGGGAPP